MRLNFNNVCFIYILANVEVAKVRPRAKNGVDAPAKEYLGSDIVTVSQGEPLSLNFPETVSHFRVNRTLRPNRGEEITSGAFSRAAIIPINCRLSKVRNGARTDRGRGRHRKSIRYKGISAILAIPFRHLSLFSQLNVTGC